MAAGDTGTNVPAVCCLDVGAERSISVCQPFRSRFGLWVAALWLFCSFQLSAQPTWKRVFGGLDVDRPHDVIVLADGNLMVLASTGSFGAGATDIYLLKIDPDGSRLWSALIGGPGIDEASALVELPDGGMMLVGMTNASSTNGYDGYVVRTDQNGVVQWQRSYGGLGWDFLRSIDADGEGGFWLVGETSSEEPGPRAWLLRIDADGDVLEERTYGVSTEAWSVRATVDGGCIFAGVVVASNGLPDAYVAKLDADAELVWDSAYGGDSLDFARDIILTLEGGYSILGSSRSYANVIEQYHVKIGADGAQDWFRHWGQIADQEGQQHLQLPTGEYASIGYVSQGGAGGTEMFLLKSAMGGDYILGQTQGGAENEIGLALARVDGGYLMCGTTESYGTGMQDIFLIRTNEVGFTTSDEVIAEFDPVSVPVVDIAHLLIFPNPSSGEFFFPASPSAVRMEVVDAAGRSVCVQRLSPGTTRVFLDLPAGLYTARLIHSSGEVLQARLTIIHP